MLLWMVFLTVPFQVQNNCPAQRGFSFSNLHPGTRSKVLEQLELIIVAFPGIAPGSPGGSNVLKWGCGGRASL